MNPLKMAGWSIESRSIGITKCSLFTRNLLLPCDLARAFIINVRRNRETRLNRECIEPCPDFYHQPNSKYNRLSSLRVNRRKVPLSNIRSNVAQTDGSRVNFSGRGQTCSAILSSWNNNIMRRRNSRRISRETFNNNNNDN